MITKISYYELLELVKHGKAPEKVGVQLAGYKTVTYKADHDGTEISCYLISNRDEQDENYRFYLAECFIESKMFDRCITILDKKPTKIEQIDMQYYHDEPANIEDLAHKVAELIEAVNKLTEEEGD